MALNLEKQLLFYGSYHHDPTNVAIHMTCVPLLLASGLFLATNSPSLIPLPDWLIIKTLPPNLATFGTIAFATVYVLMEPVAGGVLMPILFGWTALANYLNQTYGATASYWALSVHITSWIAQFIGHGVFEGRAPALLDNLVQAIVLAPFFVWMEMLFYFGYRPELKARLDEAVAVEVDKFRRSKQQSNGRTLNGKTSGNGATKEL